MSHFYNITREEMETFLTERSFQQMNLPNVWELVYGKVIHMGQLRLSLRIYTAINQNGQSREKGSDAIRLQLFYMHNGQVVPVGRPQKCLRVNGWRNRLGTAIANAADSQHFAVCSNCGHPMCWRENSKTGEEFFGCLTYHQTHCQGKPVYPRPTALPTSAERKARRARAAKQAEATQFKGTSQDKYARPKRQQLPSSQLPPWEEDDKQEKGNG